MILLLVITLRKKTRLFTNLYKALMVWLLSTSLAPSSTVFSFTCAPLAALSLYRLLSSLLSQSCCTCKCFRLEHTSPLSSTFQSQLKSHNLLWVIYLKECPLSLHNDATHHHHLQVIATNFAYCEQVHSLPCTTFTRLYTPISSSPHHNSPLSCPPPYPPPLATPSSPTHYHQLHPPLL